MDAAGNWQLAPAYDLTFSNSSHGFHSTTVAGEGKSPNTSHLLQLADTFGMKGTKAKEIIGRIQWVINHWDKYAEEAGVGNESLKTIRQQHTIV